MKRVRANWTSRVWGIVEGHEYLVRNEWFENGETQVWLMSTEDGESVGQFPAVFFDDVEVE